MVRHSQHYGKARKQYGTGRWQLLCAKDSNLRHTSTFIYLYKGSGCPVKRVQMSMIVPRKGSKSNGLPSIGTTSASAPAQCSSRNIKKSTRVTSDGMVTTMLPACKQLPVYTRALQNSYQRE